MRRAITLYALVVGATIATTPAPADERVDDRVRFAVEAIEPKADGITATVEPPLIAHLPPRMSVESTSATDLAILGSDGRPMFRIGKGGAFLNELSTEAVLSLNPTGTGGTPGAAGNGVRWRKLTPKPSIRWFERRAAYEGHGPPDRDEPARLATFRIPAAHGKTSITINGVITWKPVLGSVEAKLARVTPDEPDVVVNVVNGPVPAIQIQNGSEKTIEITGRDGRPYARVGPGGVSANVNSPTHADTRSLPRPEPGAPVRWEKQQDAPVLVWLDVRAAYAQGEPAYDVQRARRPVKLATWTIPGTIDGAPYRIEGETLWKPLRPVAADGAEDQGGTPWIALAGAAAGVGAGGIIGIRIARRRRADGPDE